ncbi:MAG: HipA domain-containing protein [Eggerthella lenta]
MGRLLVDRLLRSHGIDPFAVSPIARLAIVGFNGMGALEYVPEIPLTSPATSTDFDELARECASVLTLTAPRILTHCSRWAARWVGATESADQHRWRRLIVKFASSQDDRDIGESEYRYALRPKRAESICPKFACFLEALLGLFRRTPLRSVRCIGCCAQGAHGFRRRAFGDVASNPQLDYETLMRLTLKLTDSFEEVVRLYRLMCFNVLAGNRDDHAKNFSYLYDEDRAVWTLSPAYDLTRNAGMNGEHATTVNGKARESGWTTLFPWASRRACRSRARGR